MMRYAMYLLSTLVLFAGSAAGSWYLYGRNMPGQDTESAQAGVSGAADGATGRDALTAASAGDGELPVAVRPRPLSAEEIYQLGNVIRSREEALKEREKQIEDREQRAKLMLEDIRAEQIELEALQAKIQSQIESAESLLAKIAAEKQQAEQLRQAAEKDQQHHQQSQAQAEETQSQNVRRMAEWFQNMEAETAAEYLRELADNGKLAMAVQLLANFEERDAAKILAAMNDPALVAQLTEEFKTLKRPGKKKKP